MPVATEIAGEQPWLLQGRAISQVQFRPPGLSLVAN